MSHEKKKKKKNYSCHEPTTKPQCNIRTRQSHKHFIFELSRQANVMYMTYIVIIRNVETFNCYCSSACRSGSYPVAKLRRQLLPYYGSISFLFNYVLIKSDQVTQVHISKRITVIIKGVKKDVY